MNTQPGAFTARCKVASDLAVSLPGPVRVALHEGCPGAYRTPAGEVRPCGCDCHGEVDLEAAAEKRLHVVDEAAAADGPGATDKARRRPREAAPAGSCECCGAPTGGRFAPGHDAKLKKELTEAAAAGDVQAAAELRLRRWMHLVRHRIPKRVLADGGSRAKREGAELVRRRSRERATQRRGVPR